MCLHPCLPYTRSLPFLDATRAKRTAAAKDLLPDEVFGRIRWDVLGACGHIARS
jgi:hypothetical protein